MIAASRARPVRFSETAAVAFFVVALVIGAALRLAWLSDMEYKGDERWTFDRTQRIADAEPWPLFGMPSSVGLLNPGLSVWIFVVLAKLFAAHDPVALARAVVLVNLLAYVVLFAFVRFTLTPQQRAPWSWGLALAAVNPIAVLYERKIWPPCIFPIFTALFLLGWLRRERVGGAAAWGLVGALLGQIQMSGFFFAAAFFAWEVAFGRRRAGASRKSPRRWWGWAAGSAIGACPLVPWLRYAPHAHLGGPPFDPRAFLSLRVFRDWCADALGLGLEDHLGRDYPAFLHASVPGAPTWARGVQPVPYLQTTAFAVGVYVTLWAVVKFARCAIATARGLATRIGARRDGARRRGDRPARKRTATPTATEPRDAAAAVTNAVPAGHARDETAFTCAAAFFGFGLLVDIVVAIVHRHYLLITFPLEWVSVAYLALGCARWPRRVLAALWATQLGMSILFLVFIHGHGGAPGGDYGVSYRAQSRLLR